MHKPIIKEPSSRRIFLFVLGAHLLAILCLSTVEAWKNPPLNEIKRIVVSTVQLQPQLFEKKPAISIEPIAQVAPCKVEESPPLPTESPPTPEVKRAPEHVKKPLQKASVKQPAKSTPKKIITPTPKAVPKKSDQPKPATKKKIVPKEKAKPMVIPSQAPKIDKENAERLEKQRALLTKAQEKMNLIGKSKPLTNAGLGLASAPKKIDALNSEMFVIDTPTVLNPQELSYRDELASRLKLLMKLPEFGDVRLKLTLNRTGKVVAVKVLKSSSKSNQAQVEKMLPSLKMPAFGKNFGNEAQYTFTITMSNS